MAACVKKRTKSEMDNERHSGVEKVAKKERVKEVKVKEVDDIEEGRRKEWKRRKRGK